MKYILYNRVLSVSYPRRTIPCGNHHVPIDLALHQSLFRTGIGYAHLGLLLLVSEQTSYGIGKVCLPALSDASFSPTGACSGPTQLSTISCCIALLSASS